MPWYHCIRPSSRVRVASNYLEKCGYISYTSDNLRLLNTQQRQVLEHPYKHILAFVQSEWPKAIIGVCVGIGAGLLKELLRSDRVFKAYAPPGFLE